MNLTTLEYKILNYSVTLFFIIATILFYVFVLKGRQQVRSKMQDKVITPDVELQPTNEECLIDLDCQKHYYNTL